MDFERARRLAIRAEVGGGVLMALVGFGLGLTHLVPLPGRVDLVLALFFAAGAIACFLSALWTFFLPRPSASVSDQPRKGV
jgi:hypothetical protein